MASITIRRLDVELKRRLRLRAARNGRSMEDEVRNILRGAAASADEGSDAGPIRQSPSDPSVTSPPRALAPTSVAKRVLLIIGGGIAAYKSLDLIRRLREREIAVRCVLTAAAQEFITPLAAGALTGGRVFTDLFDSEAELDVGHIRLARQA